MPKGKEWGVFVLINLFFVLLLSRVYLTISFKNIKMNWPKYRCNPIFMPLSDNMMEDFTYCVQKTQATFMKQLMQPIMYMINGLSQITSAFDGNLFNIRKMFNYIREQIMFIIKAIFNVFMSIIVEFQRLLVSIKDLVMKVIGIVAVMINLVDGSIKTGQSAWNGPPGEMVRGIHKAVSCFHPDTKVKLHDNSVKKMSEVNLGDILEDGTKINGVLSFGDYTNETFYKFAHQGVDNDDIYVTGSHFVMTDKDRFIHVSEHPEAIKVEDKEIEKLICFVTDTKKIKIGKKIFWDYDDDELYGFTRNSKPL